MSAVLGLVLGGGVLLAASVWLWPATPGSKSRGRRLAVLEDRLTRAGLARLSPVAFLALSALCGLGVAALVVAVTGIPALGVVVVVVGGIGPTVVVTARAERQARIARRAWPDLVDHLVAGIRSGLPLGDALAALSQVGPELLRRGFAEFEGELQRSGSINEALTALQRELADPVADRVAVTIRVARELGGTQLPAILRSLSLSLRHEDAARAEAEARRSWIVAAARLGVVAPWLVLLVLATRPEAALVYASAGGTVLILAGFGATVLAYWFMLRLGRLPAEERWVL